MAPCRACGEDVPADATTCPACDYAVATHDRVRLTLGALGTALTLTVVFAPVGVPLLWAAYRHHLAADGSVTAPATPDLGPHLVAALRGHLSVEPVRDRYDDFYRGGAPRDAGDRPHPQP